MPPTSLIAKGNNTLARKWKKIKKRCSSFSSSDGLHRSKSVSDRQDFEADDDDEGIDGTDKRDRYGSIGSNDASKFRNFRDKLNQWNAEMRRRRNSQGESVSQWWQWHGTTAANNDRPRSGIVRTSSLKDARDGNPEGSDDVFVTADHHPGKQQVKSAIISTTNPYCTTARVSKSRKHHRVSIDWDTPSPSPPASEECSCDETAKHVTVSQSFNISTTSSLCHDQDSGYDGYCPDKSITSISSSENTSVASNEESHYGNTSHFKDYSIYGRLGTPRNRSGCVYEKTAFGPVQHVLNGSEPPPLPPPPPSSALPTVGPKPQQQISPPVRSQISHATVVSLVRNHVSHSEPVRPPLPKGFEDPEPPPLPPRPPSHGLSSPAPPPLPDNLQKPSVIKQTSTSLPRSRRLKKLSQEYQRRRESFHDASSPEGEETRPPEGFRTQVIIILKISLEYCTLYVRTV